MDDLRPPLPTFLIIGAQKSATRWLRSNLGLHPEIFTASSELSFFNKPKKVRRRGLDWYRQGFEGWSGQPIVGESTPGYMIWRHDPPAVAELIHELLPDVQLLALLRNPVDRAQSAMIHHIRRQRIPADADLLTLVRATPPEEERFGLIAGGWYGASLERYAELFGDQLLVLLHDDIKDDAADVYRRAAAHVGADPGYLPPELAKVRFSNRRAVPTGKRGLEPSERAELYEYFRDDIARTEELFDLDLSRWAPDAADSRPGRRVLRRSTS